MEQVFSAAHDEDMVSTYELSAYRNSIAELLFRADIVRDSKPKASYIADLGFRTSNKVLSEFHFVDYELSNQFLYVLLHNSHVKQDRISMYKNL